VFDPRFNIVSPGADASVYFAYDEADRRVTALQAGLEEMVWGGEQAPLARGTIKRDGKPLLFAMGRNDR
jgi:sucrose synthase